MDPCAVARHIHTGRRHLHGLLGPLSGRSPIREGGHREGMHGHCDVAARHRAEGHSADPWKLAPQFHPRIRNLGEELQQVVGWHHLTQLATEAMARRVTSATGATSHGASQRPLVLVLVPGETDTEREARCIAALQTLRPGRGVLHVLPHAMCGPSWPRSCPSATYCL